MAKYEVYDINNEVIDSMNDIYAALSCAECNDAKFIYDTESGEVVFSSDN